MQVGLSGQCLLELSVGRNYTNGEAAPPNLRAPLLYLALSSASQPCRPRVTSVGVRQARERDHGGGGAARGEVRGEASPSPWSLVEASCQQGSKNFCTIDVCCKGG